MNTKNSLFEFAGTTIRNLDKLMADLETVTKKKPLMTIVNEAKLRYNRGFYSKLNQSKIKAESLCSF